MVSRPRAAARERGSDGGSSNHKQHPHRENVEGTSFRASFLALAGERESELGEGGVLFAIGVALDHTLRAEYFLEGAWYHTCASPNVRYLT